MKLTLLVVFSFTFQIVYSCQPDGDLPDPRTCNIGGGCENPCRARGLSCCFCDTTVSTREHACQCCPRGHTCCPMRSWSGTIAQCCPDDYKCTNDGRCTKYVQLNSQDASLTMRNNYRQVDTKLLVTGDDKLRVWFDGKEQYLENGEDWSKIDTIPLSCKAQVITMYGENVQYRAGFLVETTDSSVLKNAVWKCNPATAQFQTTWANRDFDDSNWRVAVSDEDNSGSGSRKEVTGINRYAVWKWCNNPGNTITTNWVQYCVCRITLQCRY